MRDKYWSNELPRYCTHCGRKMVEKYKKLEGYDSQTGERPNKREYYWRCEKVGFWSYFTTHDEFLIVEEPDRMIGKFHYRGVLTIMRLSF